jgi:flagellar motor switch protein FliM
MADVLSQSEVESLLAALDPGKGQAKAAPVRKAATPGSQISVYDFKRPERVSKEQMRAFQALHDGFSREFGAALSSMLRTIVEAKLISVDQLTYSEFVFSLENPTCFTLMRSDGLDGHMILELNPAIVFPVVDRLLGGGREPRHNLPSRPLTDIESRLIGRLTDLAIRGLESAWARLCQLKLSVVQVESNPQLVQIVPPNEVIVLVSFELTMSEARGIMNLCIPFNTIEPLAGKLSSDAWSAYTKRGADTRQRLNLEASLSRAAVEVVVRLAETTISAGDLAHLAVGDVIMTEKGRDEPLQFVVEGQPMFESFGGVYKGHKAVRVGSQLSRPKDVVEERVRQSEAVGPPGPP